MARQLLIGTGLAVLAAAVVLTAIQDAGFQGDDVVGAFQAEGFELVAPPGQNPHVAGSLVFLPEGGEPFVVFVWRNDALADRYFEQYGRPVDPAETFDLKHGNVMLISDSGLTAEQRIRVRAAIQRLSDQ